MTNPAKILIVDDDPQICELLSMSLAPLGYEISSAGDGMQALERITAERFNLVLLDLMLPDPSGISILRHIRDQAAETEVIVLTAHPLIENTLAALRLGACDYLTKPFQINTIRSAVKRAIEKQRLETKLSAIHDLSREIALSLNIHQVGKTVIEIAKRVLEFETCGIGLIDQERDELYMLTGHGIEQNELRLPLNSERGIALAAVYNGEPICVPDVRDDPRYLKIRTATRSELAIPLKVGERVIGILNVESDEENAFSPSDVQLASTLAAQAAVAIENAQLYERAQHEITERRQKEEEIAQRNIQLAALNEINQAVNSTLDLEETLTLIANHSTRLMDVEVTSVLLYDEAKDDLWFAAASSMDTGMVLGQRLAMGQGVAGWVAQHGEPALVPAMSDDPRIFRGFDQEGVFTTRSLLCVPLYSKDKIIGVLEAVNKKHKPFDQNDLRLLSALAASAATAIENARLFEQVRSGREQLMALSRRLVDVQEAERGRVARELHDETSQTLSSLLLSLSMLAMEANHPQAVRTRVADMEKMTNEMLDNLHRLAMNLRPASLDILGLTPALEQYVETFGSQYSITTQFEAVGLGDKRFPPEIETAIYRIVQEALTNVLRHAQASRVDVLLEQRDGQIVTVIEDNGVGFDVKEKMPANHLGLFGMRERARMLGGNLVIESAIGAGTTISVEIPGVKREE